MADHQKVHPVQDPEAPPPPPANPTAPLVPRGSSRSDHGDPGKENNEKGSSPPPPPLRRTIPYQPMPPPKRGKKRSCWCRCLCCTLCLLFLLIVIVGAVIGILYLVFKPKLPDYSIDRLELTRFSLNQDSSLSATFNATITAKNPNEKIGIYYEDGSRISVWYTQTKLSEGSLPKFYQGHENTTVLNIELTGQTPDAAGLRTTLEQQQQQTGNIPLRVRVNQPVRVKLGKLKLMEVRFLVRCRVFVDSLAANNDIRIQSSSCKFKFRL